MPQCGTGQRSELWARGAGGLPRWPAGPRTLHSGALLVWDHVVGEKDLRWEIADPWILLAAAALATSRIRLGTAVTPVARRRPSKLAREVTTLDRLTGGRMILGAGLGDPVDGEYGSFGDTTYGQLTRSIDAAA
jgi:alkanesulfonate monooxygenase SsuD/methylene tetrahydromethanopterin reductase-like flavin-dependent oxidoreductase (luciferase family)